MNDGLRMLLEKERSVHLAEIRSLYKTLDRQFQMRAAEVPVELGYSEERLGSYTRRSHDEEEHFFFSLLFLGYCLKNPLSKEERIDLYKHEYAHYLQYHMEIPKKYTWEPGIHGSAWKYCCMLVGCVPTPYYKAGEKLLHKQDYDKILKNPIHDKTVPLRDQLRREKEYQDKKNSVVHYKIEDEVAHPKFGNGKVIAIEQTTSSVRLTIRFEDGERKIDQKWLKRQEYQNEKQRRVIKGTGIYRS